MDSNDDFKKTYMLALEYISQTIDLTNNLATFYYFGVGTANHTQMFPDPENRHEYPDYVKNLYHPHKVLILIDPMCVKPLEHSYYNMYIYYQSFVCPNFSHYKLNDDVNCMEIDVFVIKEYFYIDQYSTTNQTKIEICNQFLCELVKKSLNSNSDSLFVVSNYLGINWFHHQERINNLILGTIENINERFLISSCYLNNVSCKYNLTDVKLQPIIENERFYNPLIENYEIELIILLQIQNHSINHNLKKHHMKNLFKYLANQYMGQIYRSHRLQFEESRDLYTKDFYKTKMLEIIYKLLINIQTFIQIDQVIAQLKNSYVYSYENIINNLIEQIITIS